MDLISKDIKELFQQRTDLRLDAKSGTLDGTSKIGGWYPMPAAEELYRRRCSATDEESCCKQHRDHLVGTSAAGIQHSSPLSVMLKEDKGQNRRTFTFSRYEMELMAENF